MSVNLTPELELLVQEKVRGALAEGLAQAGRSELLAETSPGFNREKEVQNHIAR